MKVICVGDSVTYGQNVRADEAWPAVLARLTGHDVRNAGVCGDTTRLGLERFPKDVQLHKPDIVCIQFGANDANCWGTDNGQPRVSRNAYAANLWEMEQRAFACWASRVLVLQPHPAPSLSDGYNWRLEEYFGNAEPGLTEAVEYPEVSLLDDGYGLHPDPAMHERYARAVADCL